MAERTRRAIAYLQLEGQSPGPGRYDNGREATVRGVSGKKPRVVKPGCIVVKLEVRVPAQAWEPFEASAVIDVPAELVPRVVTVEAVDAND